MSSNKQLETRLQHIGMAAFDERTETAAVSIPAVRTSTVRFKNVAALQHAQERKKAGERAVTYGRIGMDTHAALEDVFIQLEEGTHCYLAPSGLSAITLTFLSFLSAGDHVLVADCAYAPVRELESALLSRLNIQVTYFSAQDDLEALCQANTRLIYVETPGSLLFEMLDLPALARFAEAKHIILATDNTWGSGYIYKPLTLGAHVSVIAGTKYIGGHSDLMLGAVVTNNPALAQQINRTHYAMGYSISADDAWLALRGVRTLPIRMQHHAYNAMTVAQYLQQSTHVQEVYHPALPTDNGHALWQRDCLGSNGMLSAVLRLNPKQARVFVDQLQLFSIGFSWGGFESLVQLIMGSELARHSYWQHGDSVVVRLHIGLESTDDLIADLQQAFDIATTV